MTTDYCMNVNTKTHSSPIKQGLSEKVNTAIVFDEGLNFESQNEVL